MIEFWRTWTTKFNEVAESDDWDRLRPMMTNDATYTVSGVPFACNIKGVDAVLAGFQKSIRNFDRHFDERMWFGVGIREFAPDVVTGRAMGVYRLGDKPLLHFSAISLWRFEDGKIAAMQDCYDLTESDVQSALMWLAEHAPDLDASYV
jgi:ketosteroid isomerase-like protein